MLSPMSSHRPTTALSRALSRAFSGVAAAAAISSSPAAPEAAAFPQKQVTRWNFDSALAELRRHVRASDFVAIDLEMTGVTSAPWRECFEFDRSDVRYLKVKDSAEKFAVVQLGVCPFRWDSNTSSFVAYPHNFYIFPRQELSTVDSSSYEFLWQTGSIDFLAKYQFDFNACVREGISYLSRRQENEAMSRLNLVYDDESSNSKENKDIPIVSMADILFSERMKKKFSEWRDWLLQRQSGEFQFQGNPNDSKQQFQTLFYKMHPAISLNGFTSHQLKLIKSVIRKTFKDLSYIQVQGESCALQELVVYTDSKEDKDLLMIEIKDERRKQGELKIQAAIGFRHVIDILSAEQKLIVGHNCFLDIAHIYSKFVGPLPSTAEEFVSSVNKYFPHVIDTKILLNTHPLLQRRMKKSKTSLSSAFTMLCPYASIGSLADALPFESCVRVEVQVDDERSSNWKSGAKHDAGYDAFMTGCIFSQASSYAGIDFKLHSPSDDLAMNEKLKKYINLLYLSWTNADIIDLRTGKKVSELTELRKIYSSFSFDNIVLIWGFLSRIKARTIKQCLAKAFGPTSVTSVYHLDETAVFVRFAKKELVSEFLCLKQSLENGNDAISVLNPITELLEGGKTRVANYETYKSICSSPVSKVLFADQAEASGIRWEVEKLVESKEIHDKKEESFSVLNSIKAASNSPEKTEQETMSKSKDDSYDNELSCVKILHSFYDSKDTQAQLRTSSNL